MPRQRTWPCCPPFSPTRHFSHHSSHPARLCVHSHASRPCRMVWLCRFFRCVPSYPLSPPSHSTVCMPLFLHCRWFHYSSHDAWLFPAANSPLHVRRFTTGGIGCGAECIVFSLFLLSSEWLLWRGFRIDLPSLRYIDFATNALSRGECQYPFCCLLFLFSYAAKEHVTTAHSNYHKLYLAFQLSRCD